MARYTPEPARPRAAAPPLRGDRVVGAAQGVVLGAIGGAAYALCEDAARAWSGVAYGPAPDEPFAATVAVGAVIGILAGASGLPGGRFATLYAALLAGWLASGMIAAQSAASGGWPSIVIAIGLTTAAVLGAGIAYAAPSPRALLGVGTGSLVALAIGATGALHLVSGVSGGAGVVAVFAIGFGVAIGLLTYALGGSAGPLHVGVAWTVLGALGGAGAALAGGPRAFPVATADAHAPIVIVVIDGLRADAVPSTAAVRALYGRGVSFPDATTTSPWALPAAASALTGALPHTHGATSPGTSVRPDVQSVIEAMRANGTVCAAVVGGADWAPATGLDHGFAIYDHATGKAPQRTGLVALAAIGLSPWAAGDDAPSVTERALAFVSAQSRSQWCLLVRYGELSVPPDDYAGAVAVVDSHVGRLVEALPNGTRIVLFGTHGVELADGRVNTSASPVNYGHSLYQEIVHVPLVVAGAGRVASVGAPVSLADVAPTLARLAGVSFVATDGVDLLARLPEDRPILAEAVRFGPERKLARRGRFKFVAGPTSGSLYDLTTDPREIAALSGMDPVDRAAEIQLRADLPAFAPVARPISFDAQLREIALRAGRRPSGLP